MVSVQKHHDEVPIGRLVVVIDIKSTGVNAGDDIVALGICGMTHDRSSVFKYRIGLDLRTSEQRSLINSGRMTWGDLWVQKGYDLRCFDRFWASRIDKLELLQDNRYIKLVNTNAELAFEVNFILKDLESKCKHIDVVTNTTAFDTVQVGRLLADQYLQPLHYSRDGRYRWTYHSTSYLVGLWGGAITEMDDNMWTVFEGWVESTIDTINPCPVKFNRTNPEDDAFAIGCRWLNANTYASIKMAKRRNKISSSSTQ